MKLCGLEELYESRCRFKQSRSTLRHWLDAARSTPEGYPIFDPIQTPRLLPFLYILEKSGDRLLYRVSGESVNSLLNMQYTARYFDDVLPTSNYEKVAPLFFDVLRGKALHFRGLLLNKGRDPIEFERTALPITRAGKTMLLGCSAYSYTATPLPGSEQACSKTFEFNIMDLEAGTWERKTEEAASFNQGNLGRFGRAMHTTQLMNRAPLASRHRVKVSREMG